MTYEEYKRKRQERDSAATFTSYESYKYNQKAPTAKSVIDNLNARVQNWFNNNSTFMSDYTSRFGNRTGSYSDSYVNDAKSAFEYATNQKQTFDKELQDILAIAEEYKDFLSLDYRTMLSTNMKKAQEAQKNMLKGYSADVDYWSQWENENAYKEWADVQKQHEEWAAVNIEGERSWYERDMQNLAKAKEWEKAYGDLNYDQNIADLEIKIWWGNYGEGESEEEAIDDLEKLKAGARNAKAQIMRLTLGKGIDEFEKYLSEKNVYLTNAERYQKSVELASAVNAPDFEEYAQKGIEQEAEYYKLGSTFSKEGNKIVAYKNHGFTYAASHFAGGGGGNSDVYLATEMTDDEVKIYSYYYAKEGEAKADEYFDSIRETLEGRQAGKIVDAAGDSKALSLILKGAAGLDQWRSGAEGFWNMLTGDDAYVAPSAIQIAASSDKIKENLPGAWGVAGDLLQTTANQLPSIMLSFVPVVGQGLSLASMGISASGNAYTEMINAGYSKEQAKSYGMLVGGSEVILGSLLDGTMKVAGKLTGITTDVLIAKFDKALARVAINTGSRMLGEFTEESLQTILEPWFKSVVANTEYDPADLDEILYSGLLGALSAGALGNVDISNPNTIAGATANAINKYKSNVAVGKQISGVDGAVNRLVELGSVQSADSVAYKVAEKINKRLADGKKVGAYTIAKLFNAEKAALTDANVADITRSLTEKGVTESDAKTISAWMAKAVEGVPLTEEQANALENNPLLDRTFQDVIINPNSTVYQRTKQMSDFVSDVNRGEITQNRATTATPATDTAKAVNTTESATTQEDATEGKFKASVDGKTVLTETAEAVNPVGIESIKNGSVKVKLENGKVVDASEISFATLDEAVLYDMVSKMDVSPESAMALIKNFKATDGVSAERYAIDAPLAYKYGTINYAKGLENITDLTPAQRQTAYYIGQNAASAQVKAQQAAVSEKSKESSAEKRAGKVYYESAKGLTERQKTSLKALEIIAQALGIDFYIFESEVDENGKRKGANGWFDPNDSSIHIDLYAGAKGEGVLLFTAAHELTHFIKKWSPAKFKVFADFLIEQYGEKGVSVDTLVRNQIAKAKANGRDISFDTAYEEVIADSCETMLADGDIITKISELKAKDKTLWQKIKDFLTDLVAKIKAAYAKLSPDSAEGKYVAEMLDKAEQLKAMWTEAAIDAGNAYNTSSIVEIDTESQSVSPAMFSERTWTASEYVTEREETAKKISAALGVDIKTAYKYIDDINGVARLIADDRARLDYEPNLDDTATVLKPNSEYKYSVDMSTLCAKRLLFTGTFDAIQKALPNKVFDSEEIVALREMMQNRGYEVACGICYVESTRREIGRITQDFIDRYKVAQKTGKPISRINSSGNEVVLTSGGKTFNADKNYTPNLGELNTTDIDIVKRDHRDVYDAYLAFMNARGQAKPKLLETRAEYKGEILRHFKAKSAVEARNSAGGLRLQSFSDFEVPHMIDMMQVVMDMSRVGLKSQAYTKVPAFAEIFGDTGVKINLSLIAKGDGLDAKGNLIFDDVEGINHDEAFKLRDQYSKNVGTILVGKTDAHIIAAMADPRIDFIIPFHKSSWKESLYDALGLTGYADYTEYQNEKSIDKSRKISNYDPSEYWDFTKSGDENAQIYLAKCREDGRIPKFPQFQGYPGYWKLLIDFKMYDNDGVGSPQEVVQPIFNTEASERILGEYKGEHKSLPVAKDVVEDFVKEFGKDVVLSDRISYSNDSDRYSYETLTSKDDIEVKTLPKLPEAEIMKYQKNTILFGKDMRDIAASAKHPKNTPTKTYLHCRDLGVDVLITRDSFKHGAERIDGAYIAVCKNIADILNDSIVVNELAERETTNGGYVLLGMAETEDSYVVVRSIVNNKTWKLEEFQELNAIKKKSIKKEDVGLKPPHYIQKNGFGTSSVISIADFLKFVNTQNIANTVLSSDVVDKLGTSRGFDKNITPNLLYSERNNDSFSNRSLLANALEGVAQNDIEKNKLAQYKAKIDLLTAEEQKLQGLRAEIKELSFAKGPRDTKQIRELQDEATKTANRINIYDRQLLNIEATTALKNVLEREKARVRKAEAQKGKEALKAYREKAETELRDTVLRYQESRHKAVEGRHKTEERHAIAKIAKDLDKLLNHGTKERNVKKGASDLVRSALDLANMYFASDDDIITSGIATQMTDAETKLIEKYTALYDEYHSYDDSVTANKVKRAELRSKMNAIRSELSDVLEREKKRINDTTASGIYDTLIKEYKKLSGAEESYLREAFNQDVVEYIEEMRKKVGNNLIGDMTLEQLKDLHRAFTMIKTVVQKSNKLFGEKNRATIAEQGESAIAEIEKQGHKATFSHTGKLASTMSFNNLKPIYLIERTKSKVLLERMQEILDGESIWALDMEEGRAFMDEAKKKHGYDKWDFDKAYEFETETGLKYSLTLGEIFSIYAYSKRGEQALNHLRVDGFVFDKTKKIKNGKGFEVELNDSTSYAIDDKTRLSIIGKLTAEQRAFIDETQKYLSEVMGEKGNEVSREMYGIDLFGEENYFPLRAEGAYLERAREQASGQVKYKNRGFTKATQEGARNSVVLSDYSKVWAEHVAEISGYHAFTLAHENFYKVYNYQNKSSTETNKKGVIPALNNAYGDGITKAIDQLLTDLNGGARSDPRESPFKIGLSLFKKAKTMFSLSVIIQQPSSLLRAQAMIDAKYFVGFSKGKHKDLWNEIKKYAPVAVIKEMGRFDVGMGRSSAEWLLNDKSWREIVDDFLSKGASYADEVAWIKIWNAVKRETLHTEPTLKPNSEEFLKKAGQRFEDIIRHTQVYDSTLSRSGNMRSKSGLMQVVTAFLAEPTTAINMREMALRSGDMKRIIRTTAAVYASTLLNAVLVALPYAMRDDDEDETFIEKYATALTTSFVDNINPLTSLPFIKDIYSMLQGYDVKRSDMALADDLINSFEKFTSAVMDEEKDKEKITDSLLSLVGDLSSFTGLPVDNAIREVKSIVNFAKTLMKDFSDRDTTWLSLADNLQSAFTKETPIVNWFFDEERKTDKLYDAIMKGDKAYADRIKGTYKTEASLETAMRSALREHDFRIKEAAEARIDGDIAEYTRIVREITSEGKFVQDIVVGAINAEINAINKAAEEGTETEEKIEEATSIYRADDINATLESGDITLAKEIISELIEVKSSNSFNKAKAEAEKEGKRFDEKKEREEAEKSARSSIKSSITKHWKSLAVEAFKSNDRTELLRIRDLLFDTGLYGRTRSEVYSTMMEWRDEDK